MFCKNRACALNFTECHSELPVRTISESLVAVTDKVVIKLNSGWSAWRGSLDSARKTCHSQRFQVNSPEREAFLFLNRNARLPVMLHWMLNSFPSACKFTFCPECSLEAPRLSVDAATLPMAKSAIIRKIRVESEEYDVYECKFSQSPCSKTSSDDRGALAFLKLKGQISTP